MLLTKYVCFTLQTAYFGLWCLDALSCQGAMNTNYKFSLTVGYQEILIFGIVNIPRAEVFLK